MIHPESTDHFTIDNYRRSGYLDINKRSIFPPSGTDSSDAVSAYHLFGVLVGFILPIFNRYQIINVLLLDFHFWILKELFEGGVTALDFVV